MTPYDDPELVAIVAAGDTSAYTDLYRRHVTAAQCLARQVALSRSAFAARFRELVGESPKRYITRTRLAHGAALLNNTDAPLAEIAARAGYSTAYSFGKAFKRMFGIAPGFYRGTPNGS